MRKQETMARHFMLEDHHRWKKLSLWCKHHARGEKMNGNISQTIFVMNAQNLVVVVVD
jgi:hypothetical protein